MNQGFCGRVKVSVGEARSKSIWTTPVAGLPFRALVGVVLALFTSAAIAVTTLSSGAPVTIGTASAAPPAAVTPTPTALTHHSATDPVQVPALGQQVVAMMDDLTAVFEHGKTAPQYATIVNDHDGCGMKAGWLSFCSKNGDMYTLVDQHSATVPNNPLVRHLPALRQLADKHSDDTGPLGNTFEADWKDAAADDKFRQVQLRVGHDLYLTPAQVLAAQLGVKTNLGVEVLFDTALTMGLGADACDGLPKIAAEATAVSSGTPASGVSEKAWLSTFNQVRLKHMKTPCTPDRQKLRPTAVDRVQALQSLADQGRWDLSAPITLGAGTGVTIKDPHD